MDVSDGLVVFIMQDASSTMQAEAGAQCHGCSVDLSAVGQDALEPGVVLQCPACKQYFCFDCDVYIHESLHNCPGCECSTDGHEHDE